MTKQFNIRLLFIQTILMVLAGLALYSDNDSAALVYVISGFLYSIILYVSLINKPRTSLFIIGFLILGISNILSIYSSFVTYAISLLHPILGELLILIIPSLIGAIITFVVLKFLWSLYYTKKQFLVILLFILIGSSISTTIMPLIKSNRELSNLVFSLNSIMWVLFFTLGIMTTEYISNRENKQL